jgi:LSD1 subclass zinc finger protein
MGVAIDDDTLDAPLLGEEHCIPDDMTVIHCDGCGTLLQASSEGTTVQCVLCDTLTPIGGPPASSSMIPGGAWLTRTINGMVETVAASVPCIPK